MSAENKVHGTLTFADPAAAEDMGEREAFGMRYRLRAYRHGRHRVWGATARVLESVFELLRE